MAQLTALRREQVADLLARRGPSILRDVEAGISYEAIGRRLGVSGKTVAAFVSRERQRRNLAGERQLPETRPGSGVHRLGSAVALLSDSLLDDLAAAVDLEGTSQPPRPQPMPWERTPDDKPEQGDDDLPGYAAWELVHGAGMPVREAVRKLGLRYPSDVYALLEQHKRGLDAKRQAVGEGNRQRHVA